MISDPTATRRLPQPWRERRAGVSTIEFALVAPIMFFIVLAMFTFSSLMMSQNTLTNAAREGGRIASLPGTTSSTTVVTAVQNFLQAGGVSSTGVTVTVTPTTMTNLKTGDEVRVAVAAPIANMAWFWAVTAPSGNLTAEATYLRE